MHKLVARREMVGGKAADRAKKAEKAGYVREYGPGWTACAADVVMNVLKDEEKARGSTIDSRVQNAVESPAARKALLAAVKRLGGVDAERVVAESLSHYSAEMGAASTHAQKVRVSKAFLRPIRKRVKGVPRPVPLLLDVRPSDVSTFRAWLSKVPSRDRHREWAVDSRAALGVAKWKVPASCAGGVIVYERAWGRIQKERPGCAGVPDRKFVRGLVHASVLPTALASDGDHYIHVGRGSMRWWTVNEVARSFGVPATCPVMAVLRRDGGPRPHIKSAQRAVNALGRAVHVDVVRALLRPLMKEGHIRKGMSYGSACSGLDLIAAALWAELEGDFRYVFGSERDEELRKCLVESWSCRSGPRVRCHERADGEAATGEEPVDFWSMTAGCEKFSKRNHGRDTDEGERNRGDVLGDMNMILQYVRNARPKVVMVENVSEAEVVAPLTSLLTRLEGYRVAVGEVTPQDVGKPVVRERTYWVLVRLDP